MMGMDYKKPIKEWYERYINKPEKDRTAGEKAAITKEKNKMKRSYDQPEKNGVRFDIVDDIRKYVPKDELILALDGEEFMFTRSLSEYQFVIAEYIDDTWKKMKKKKKIIKNLRHLHHGCISELDWVGVKFGCVYLDFTGTLSQKQEDIMMKLLPKIIESRIVALTFATAPGRNFPTVDVIKEGLKKYIGDHFELINERLTNDKTTHMVTFVYKKMEFIVEEGILEKEGIMEMME